MGKKIESPLKNPDSMVGKVYEIAFPDGKDSFAKISREYLRREGKENKDFRSWNGKISEAIRNYEDYFDLNKEEGGRGKVEVKSRVEPIIDHVNQEIKKLNELSPLNYETLTEKEEKSLREYLDKTFRKKIKEEEEVYKEKKERAEKSSLSIKTQYPYGILQSFYDVISKTLILREIRNETALQICEDLDWGFPVEGNIEEEKLERLQEATELEISDVEIKNLQKRFSQDLSRKKIRRGGNGITHPITFYLGENPDYLIKEALDKNFVQAPRHWIGKLASIPEINSIVKSHGKAVRLGFEIYSRGFKNMREEV